LTSAFRAWNAKSRRPLWTLRTVRHVRIPTRHGTTSRSRSTWRKEDLWRRSVLPEAVCVDSAGHDCGKSAMSHDFNVDSKKEKKMKVSYADRANQQPQYGCLSALIATAGLFLIAMFHTGAVAKTKSPEGIRNIVIVHGAWADGSSWSKVIPLL